MMVVVASKHPFLWDRNWRNFVFPLFPSPFTRKHYYRECVPSISPVLNVVSILISSITSELFTMFQEQQGLRECKSSPSPINKQISSLYSPSQSTMNPPKRRSRLFCRSPPAPRPSFAIYDRDDDMCYNYRNNDERLLSCGSPVGIALSIFYRLQRTGVFSGVQLSSEVIQILDERQLIKHGCARQSKRLLLSRVRDIPDPKARSDFAELLARHAKQGDLNGVSLRLEVCRDTCIQLPLLESLSVAFERQSVEQLILQIDTKDKSGSTEHLTLLEQQQYSTRLISQVLRRLVRIPRNELFLSIECDGSSKAERACMNVFRALRNCRHEISPSCEVRVVLHNDMFHTPGISESLASCCNVVSDLRLQSASTFTFKSLSILLRSASHGSSSPVP